MRALLVAALAALALIAAGCGGGGLRVASGADLGTDAAKLVPAGALAFVSVDTDQASQQRTQLDALTNGLPLRTELANRLSRFLAKKGLDYDRDVKPALGPELDVAVLSEQGKPQAIALARPDDQSKLAALAAKFDHGDEHYTVQQIGGWSVVADSSAAFASVRAAQTSASLADSAAYAAARNALPGDSLVRAFVAQAAFAGLPPQVAALLPPDKPAWAEARVAADSGALRLELASAPTPAAPATGANLLGDVPSGAILAVSFHGSAQLVGRLRSLSSTATRVTLPLRSIAPVVNGDGVLFARASGLIPVFAVELAPHDPVAALAALRKLVAQLERRLGGTVTLVVQKIGDRVYVADSPAAIGDLRGSGPKLVDDPPFKDALAAAGAPANPTLLVYADGKQLAPLVQAAAPLLGGMLPTAVSDTLSHVATVVAFAARTPNGGRAAIRIELQK